MAVEMTPVTAPEPVYRSPWQKWVGFWFPAADPTTLGFIRIMTGLLVLYIHLAYSVDLQAFFGRHAWYSQSYIERERHEFPWNASPLWDWKPDAVVPAKVPEFPHRRRAFLDFMRGLPADELAEAARSIGCDDVVVVDHVERAIDLALTDAMADDAVLVSGSLYVVGAARPYLRKVLP